MKNFSIAFITIIGLGLVTVGCMSGEEPPIGPDAGTPPVDGAVTTPACADGVDNDGDGFIDLNDPGCASASDNDETNPPPQAQVCTTDAQCNNAQYNFIKGTCHPASAMNPRSFCTYETRDCGQLWVDTWPTARYITPWGTHGPAQDIEFTTVIATPGTWQLMRDTPAPLDGACSARAYDAQWREVPIRVKRMWDRTTMSPLLPLWTVQQPESGWYKLVTFDGWNNESWTGSLPSLP